MSLLPNNTFTNPQVSFYGLAGGAASSLQSPVSVIPDGAGDANLIVQAAGTGQATIEAIGSATNAGGVIIGGGGTSYRIVATPPLIVGGNNFLQIGLDSAVAPAITYTPVSSTVSIGDGGANGLVQTNNALLVKDPDGGSTNGIGITPLTNSTSVIAQTVGQGGTLNIGSSAGNVDTIQVIDTTGSGSGIVKVGGNGAADILLAGSNGASIPAAVVRTDAASSGILNLGSSDSNPQTVFVVDTGAANSGFVDITKGTSTGIALRLQGYGTGTTATVSSNLGSGGGGSLSLSSGYNEATPAITITDTTTSMNRAMTTFVAPTAGAGTTYTGISRQSIAGGGSIGTTAYALTNPAGAGVYTIMVQVGDNAAVNINGQIDSVGYYNGTKWIAGGVNVSPPLGTGNLILWFGSTGTSRNTIYIQNTGSADLSSVVVYMIPQIYGLQAVIT
jgi:hypothetical protein